jgi:hypothetical protein
MANPSPFFSSCLTRCLTILWISFQGVEAQSSDTVLDRALPNRSTYDFGLRPNALYTDNAATIAGTPDCRVASGIIREGLFCGARGDFDGKYSVQVCASSQINLARIRAKFEEAAAYWTFESCLDMLLKSSLYNDCIQINGKYIVVETIIERRAILPDCCITLVQVTTPNCPPHPLFAS